MSNAQITNRIMMVRPARFGFNPETAASNSFQRDDDGLALSEIQARARKEFDSVVETLRDRGVEVLVIEDTPEPKKTDAVFPNNWISFHRPGRIVTYPMMAPSRRTEIRDEILDELAARFVVDEVWRLDQSPDPGQFLEGTGSLVLDRVNRIAYACRSPRTSETLLERFCRRMNYRAVVFDAENRDGIPVYHTNVIMAVTQKQVVICLDSVPDPDARTAVRQAILASGKSLVEIGFDQVERFAGNMLQVGRAGSRPLLVMSSSARDSLNQKQLARLEDESDLVAMPIPVIETSGGSIRCMLAEIFLEKR